jgi:hypothetical protein
MLLTSKSHFDQDIGRARALCVHAAGLPAGPLAHDIFRASWMMAVGACDAYFSDAYADLISRALRAKDLQPAINIPDRLNSLKVPVTAIIRAAHGGWRWRMAARELMETENVLSLEKIKLLFNHFFRKTHKLFNQDAIEPWILHPDAQVRLFGLTTGQYQATPAANKPTTRKQAVERFEGRFEQIFQRRHDCIHNCDRPKVALQAITTAQVQKAVDDIAFLVNRCPEASLAEFPHYLVNLGFNGATRNQVCMP